MWTKCIPAVAILLLPSLASPEISVNLDEIVNASYRMDSSPIGTSEIDNAEFRGWAYVAKKLRADGVTDEELRAVYTDQRMPIFTPVPFSVSPRESSHMYTGFTNPKRLQLSREFLARNRKVFDQVEKAFPVDRNIISALFLIETHYGRVTGREIVVNRLSRLASVKEPENLARNVAAQRAKNPKVTEEQVTARAQYLEDLFYPEVLALFRIARLYKLDVLSFKGSSAGAFGIPQFLPSNYLKFGIDADKDGRISLYEDADAIWSTANFLTKHGWNSKGTHEVKRQAVWKYNPSEPYVATVLKVAELLEKPDTAPAKSPAKPKAKASKTAKAKGKSA